jgi:hypothetical protein
MDGFKAEMGIVVWEKVGQDPDGTPVYNVTVPLRVWLPTTLDRIQLVIERPAETTPQGENDVPDRAA